MCIRDRRRDAAGVLQQARQVQDVPREEDAVARGPGVVLTAAVGVEVGRPGPGLAHPVGVGLRRDRQADVLQRIEQLRADVLAAVLVAGRDGRADLAVVRPLAVLVELAGVRVPADRLIGSGDAAQRLVDLLTVASCAVQLGVTEGALKLTAEYAKVREQFDRPIGTFQAVSQRLADGYIDTRFLALTVWQAAWRLAESLPSTEAIATAKLWASDAGHHLAHTTVHIHGGVGIDLDGEAHRYFTAATRYDFEYGGATEQALRLGKLLAAEPA